ncbi:MAG: hypothetical protein ABGY08_08545 [Gammaproteobacteria bacterium]|jgi:hypothetical protein
MNNVQMICITVVLCTLMLSVAISRVDFDVICKTAGACVVQKD